eukprot:COSAG01_NODE_145_length_24103_cov_41.178012_28_plen_78_part_00
METEAPAAVEPADSKAGLADKAEVRAFNSLPPPPHPPNPPPAYPRWIWMQDRWAEGATLCLRLLPTAQAIRFLLPSR